MRTGRRDRRCKGTRLQRQGENGAEVGSLYGSILTFTKRLKTGAAIVRSVVHTESSQELKTRRLYYTSSSLNAFDPSPQGFATRSLPIEHPTS
jgi:hypothetical protein